ncbi:MAG: ECF-type sigma factor [Planctomycetia bacterium]|nr:ECF-type sigma factor [Planctomycetia bacterium]
MPLLEGELTDRSLLRRFRSGEEDAATRLYVRYARRLEALARAQSGAALAARLDPEDIVQSVFRTFFRRASAGQYEIPEGEELWKLFLVIALNKIRAQGAYHRAAKRDAGATCSASQAGDALEAAAREDEAPLRMLQIVVDELLAELPDAHRNMIEMRIAGHEVNEIATETGRAKRSVERVLQQFRQRLGTLIGDSTHGD